MHCAMHCAMHAVAHDAMHDAMHGAAQVRAAFVWNQKQLTVTVNPDVLPTELCHPLNWMQPCPYDGVTGGPPPRYGSLEVGYNLEIGGEAVGGGRVYSKLATGRFPNPARVGQMMIRSVQDDLWRAADFYAQEAEAARTSEAKEQREALTLSLALTLALAPAPTLNPQPSPSPPPPPSPSLPPSPSPSPSLLPLPVFAELRRQMLHWAASFTSW